MLARATIAAVAFFWRRRKTAGDKAPGAYNHTPLGTDMKPAWDGTRCTIASTGMRTEEKHTYYEPTVGRQEMNGTLRTRTGGIYRPTELGESVR